MCSRLEVVLVAVLSAVCVNAACGDESAPSPSAPSATPAPAQPTPAPPTRLPAQLVGVWSLSLSVTEATGAGCVAEAFRARIGEPDAYSLGVSDSGAVTISSRSDALSCSFSAAAVGDDGFTTYGVPGMYLCVGEPRTYRCADGTEHRYYTFGQDIDGKVSGGRISGTWMVYWYEVGNDAAFVEAKYQYSGAK